MTHSEKVPERWCAVPAPRELGHGPLLGLGRVELLAQSSLALLSSAKAPAGILLAIHDLAQRWRREGPVIMSGFQAPVENEALAVLLRGPQPVVVWLARGPLTRLPPAYLEPLAAGRLLLVTPFAADVRRVTADTAQVRNRLAALAAQIVLIAHAEPQSKTYALAAELVAAGRVVYTVEHPANRRLCELGVPVIGPQSSM